jgi:hypothetical protein
MNLTDGQRQNIQNEQLVLAFTTKAEGEARRAVHEGIEPFAATSDLECRRIFIFQTP